MSDAAAVPTVSVVVLAYGAEPWLEACVDAVLAAEGVDVDVVVVDNGGPPDALARVGDRPGTTVVRSGGNTGFAGGCNLGAAHGRGAHVALVNSDCLVAPDTLALLVAEAGRAGVGPVMASVRMADDPAVVNSAGNPVHVLGICWAGGLGDPEDRTAPYDVPTASGACLLLTRGLWERLGGFDETYFAYLEDTEMSLRCRRMGLVPRCVPTAVARHHYEFSRNPTKMFLLERNRLLLVGSLWNGRALLALAPLLLAFEIALLPLAVAQGWGRQKLRAWWWLGRHAGRVRDRRRRLAAERTVDDAVWMAALTPRFPAGVVGSPTGAAVANAVVERWWRRVLSAL